VRRSHRTHPRLRHCFPFPRPLLQIEIVQFGLLDLLSTYRKKFRDNPRRVRSYFVLLDLSAHNAHRPLFYNIASRLPAVSDEFLLSNAAMCACSLTKDQSLIELHTVGAPGIDHPSVPVRNDESKLLDPSPFHRCTPLPQNPLGPSVRRHHGYYCEFCRPHLLASDCSYPIALSTPFPSLSNSKSTVLSTGGSTASCHRSILRSHFEDEAYMSFLKIFHIKGLSIKEVSLTFLAKPFF